MLNKIIYKFYGTGLGTHFPFKQLFKIYQKIRLFFPVKKITNEKISLYLEPGKLIDDIIMSKGVREENITKLFKQYIQKGDYILDIGANIGYYTLLAAKLTGKKGKVIAFEPNTKNINRLQKNIQLNKYENIKIVQKGVSNKEGRLNLFYDEQNPGATSLIKRDNHIGEYEEIEIIVLDDFLKNKKIDFIKMDIEGYEGEAIEGMINILKKNNLKMIFEFSPIIYQSRKLNHKDYCTKMLSTLTKIGYILYHIDDGGNLNQINNINEYIQKINSLSVPQSDIFISK